MPVYIKSNEKILFVHIPKTGGSSFEEVMKKRGWREYLKLNGLSLSDIEFMKVSPQHYHSEIFESLFNLEKFNKIISIVRNPFDRFKSEFYWQHTQGFSSAGPSEWTHQVFDEFKKNPYAYDNHIRPQTDFLVKGCEVFILETGGVEKALKFCNELPTASVYNLTGLFSVLKKEIRLKVSPRIPRIEEEFEAVRPMIEAFYSEDIIMYSHFMEQ